MSRLLSAIALLLFAASVLAAHWKVSQDRATMSAERQAGAAPAPQPLVPAGLDGRPLDPAFTQPAPPPPPPGSGPPPRGQR